METPKTPAGRLTELVMFAIREHVRDAHYNPAWSKVHEVLDKELTPLPSSVVGDGTPSRTVTRCPKMVKNTLYRCRRALGHAGGCSIQPE